MSITRCLASVPSGIPDFSRSYSSSEASGLSSCYLFIFTSFILISIPPTFCAGSGHYVNQNKPSQFLNVQALHTLSRLSAPPPQNETRSSYAWICPASASSACASKLAVPSEAPVDSPTPSSQPSFIPPPPNVADSPITNSLPPFTPRSLNREGLAERPWKIKAIAIPSAVLGLLVLCFVIIYTVKKGHLSRNKMVCWERRTRNSPFNDEEIMKNFGSMVPKQYTYSEVKRLTNSFKNKIGKGGYGIVYKGTLPNERLVAVKVLTDSKGNGEEFINEVTSISRTSHVNIVNLVGFCYERSSRALIYEFMPNGSLDQFIYNRRSLDTTCHLDRKTMFQIAIGIARGLEYLHSGCRTRILHLDIKPHNILLDEDLCPKISDFGLAKLCKRKESIVSMIDMRGTIGYIAPEIFSRNFGAVSHKSDVYSYGMLILEMIGGRKNFDSRVSHSSARDFSYWIYTKLKEGKILDTFEEGIKEEEEEEDEDIGKKMILVGLWCIQTNPFDRPSIGKVIEMLEGTLQSIQFPPRPFLFSAPQSPQDSFAT